MIHSSRRERKTKAIVEVLAMLADAHPELVRHRPRGRAAIKDEKLTWIIAGSENTIDHYSILAKQASQWINVAGFPAGSNAVRLTDLPLPPETRALCVQAVGKASMLNHSSGPINYSPEKSPSQTP